MRQKVRDTWVPLIAIAGPLMSFGLKKLLEFLITNYEAGYEILVMNGMLTFVGLWLISIPVKKEEMVPESADKSVIKE